jgi:hypothetical protein
MSTDCILYPSVEALATHTMEERITEIQNTKYQCEVFFRYIVAPVREAMTTQELDYYQALQHHLNRTLAELILDEPFLSDDTLCDTLERIQQRLYALTWGITVQYYNA